MVFNGDRESWVHPLPDEGNTTNMRSAAQASACPLVAQMLQLAGWLAGWMAGWLAPIGWMDGCPAVTAVAVCLEDFALAGWLLFPGATRMSPPKP